MAGEYLNKLTIGDNTMIINDDDLGLVGNDYQGDIPISANTWKDVKTYTLTEPGEYLIVSYATFWRGTVTGNRKMQLRYVFGSNVVESIGYGPKNDATTLAFTWARKVAQANVPLAVTLRCWTDTASDITVASSIIKLADMGG